MFIEQYESITIRWQQSWLRELQIPAPSSIERLGQIQNYNFQTVSLMSIKLKNKLKCSFPRPMYIHRLEENWVFRRAMVILLTIIRKLIAKKSALQTNLATLSMKISLFLLLAFEEQFHFRMHSWICMKLSFAWIYLKCIGKRLMLGNRWRFLFIDAWVS